MEGGRRISAAWLRTVNSRQFQTMQFTVCITVGDRFCYRRDLAVVSGETGRSRCAERRGMAGARPKTGPEVTEAPQLDVLYFKALN